MPDDRASANIHVLENSEEVARAVALRFVELAREAIDARARFSVALAGGSTPRRVYELLAEDAQRQLISWPRVHLFFGDERCVPPDDPASNYRMAHEALLSRVALPPPNVHRMKGELAPTTGARFYEEELRSFFADPLWPRFDLIILGMGDDGHTASLFPYSAALNEQALWVVANRVEKLETFRLTLTAPAINRAAHLIFIVTGAAKSARLAEVLNQAPDPRRLPAQLIRPLDGTLEWYVDKPAAALL